MTAGEAPIQQIAVIGAGLMGHGIALELAANGRSVRLFDANPDVRSQAPARVAHTTALLLAAGNFTGEQAAAVTANITYPNDLGSAVDGVEMVIEAVFEDLPTKQTVFRALDEVAPKSAILASNTSSYLPSDLASVTTTPERVVVTHYFYPPYLLPAVEIVPGPATSPEVTSRAHALFSEVGKAPVVLSHEVMGFVANRLQAALLREALAIVAAGIASPQDVDTIIHTGMGRRLALAGVFEVRDLAGWPVSIKVHEDLVGQIDRSPDVPPTLATVVASFGGDSPEKLARRSQISAQLAALDQMLRSRPEAAGEPA